MAPTPGDCAIAKPIQPTSDQQPTTGFHAELQTMGHAQLSVPASAPSEKCTSTLPNLQIDGSETAASTVSDATKSAQQIDSGKASHPTYDNSYYPSGKSPVSPSPYEALDLDPRPPVNEQNSNLNALKPYDNSHLPPGKGSAIQSTYEALDLDVRTLPVNGQESNATAIKSHDNSLLPSTKAPVNAPESNLNAISSQGQNGGPGSK